MSLITYKREAYRARLDQHFANLRCPAYLLGVTGGRLRWHAIDLRFSDEPRCVMVRSSQCGMVGECNENEEVLGHCSSVHWSMD